MLNLPWTIIDLLNPFVPVFYGETTWEKAKTLLIEAILAPGKRTVSAVPRLMGLAVFSVQIAMIVNCIWGVPFRTISLMATAFT